MRGRTSVTKAPFKPNCLKANLNKYMLMAAVIKNKPVLPNLYKTGEDVIKTLHKCQYFIC